MLDKESLGYEGRKKLNKIMELAIKKQIKKTQTL
jgi:hypothetical protein